MKYAIFYKMLGSAKVKVVEIMLKSLNISKNAK